MVKEQSSRTGEAVKGSGRLVVKERSTGGQIVVDWWSKNGRGGEKCKKERQTEWEKGAERREERGEKREERAAGRTSVCKTNARRQAGREDGGETLTVARSRARSS